MSDPSLLEILGQASDSHTIQAHLLSIFENIASVKFDPGDYNKIVAVISKEGEVVSLDRAVRAEGSVEIWLMQLLTTAKESLNSIIRNGYHIITDTSFDMLEFIKKYQAQVGILGIQMIWTRDSETALQVTLASDWSTLLILASDWSILLILCSHWLFRTAGWTRRSWATPTTSSSTCSTPSSGRQ